ncbi:MAG: iron ABC transporter permease [Spirochaetia bacterium]|nr:iron ABC transporter permease [Spirochaetia bacterium]
MDVRSYRHRHRRDISLILGSAPGIILLTLLFLIPVGMVLIGAFRAPDGSLTAANLLDVAADPYSWRIAWFTFLQAAVSTLAALALGLPGAYILSHYQFRGKRLLQSLSQLPFVLPSILVVLGFVIFFGNSGVLNRALMDLFDLSEPPVRLLYSFKSIILAHAFYNFPIALSMIASFWEQLNHRQEYAALTLGAQPMRVFASVTAPRLMPAITAAASMIFLFCFTSFSIILVLGGGPRFTTLEVQIYQLARVRFDLPHAAAFALFSLAISSGVLIFYIRSQHWMQRASADLSYSLQPKAPRRTHRVLIMLYGVIAGLLIIAPLGAIAVRSFQAPVFRTGTSVWTFRWYEQLIGAGSTPGSFTGSSSAIVTSLSIASIVTLITIPSALSLGTLIIRLERRASMTMETILMLPMAISSVILGLGYSIIARMIPVEHITYLLIIGAHTVITLPFMLRAILPTYRTIHAAYTPAALILGARPFRTFLDIQLPLLSRAIASGAIFVFAISIGEMHATMLLSDARVVTIPILLYRLIGAYNFNGACALGTLLMAICLLLFALTNSLHKREL